MRHLYFTIATLLWVYSIITIVSAVYSLFFDVDYGRASLMIIFTFTSAILGAVAFSVGLYKD